VIRGALVVVFVTLAPVAARADDVADAAAERLTLADAVAAAVAANPELGIAAMEVVAAEAAIDAEAGTHDATLEVSAAAAAARRDPSATPLSQELDQEQLALAVAIGKQMIHGGAVQLRVATTYTRRTAAIPSATARSYVDVTAATPEVSLEWREPIVGGRAAGAAALRARAAERDAAANDRAAAAIRLVRDVERGYWQLYLAERALDIHRAAVDRAADQLAIVASEVEHGARPRLATAEVEEELARRREDALIAAGEVAERSLALSRALGRAPTTALRTADDPPDAWTPPSAAAVTAAVAAAPEVAAAVARGDAAAAELARASDTTGWRVDAYVRASASADSDRLADALTRTAGYGGVTAEVGLTVQVPLGARTRRGAVGAARAQLVAARLAVADAEAAVAAAVTYEQDRLELARARRAALARSVELAETNRVAEERRWERGDTTAFEVLRRQTAVSDVELRAARALVDELDARAGLDALTGALLTRHHVELR
jgi:outer membrane protein